MKGFVAPSSNYLYTSGFTMVSNLLMDYQKELDITNEELSFIIKIYRNVRGYKIHDSILDPTVSTRTLQRRRKSLKDKKLINYVVYKSRTDDGHVQTDGISYDLTLLENKLQAISQGILSKKKEKIEKKEENSIVESEEENTPLDKYLKDWKEYTGKDYSITSFETSYYNKMTDEDKNLVAYIFEMPTNTGDLDKVTPRLSLFFKTKFRMNQLRKYYRDNVDEEYDYDGDETEEEKEIRKIIETNREYDEKVDKEVNTILATIDEELSDRDRRRLTILHYQGIKRLI